ncbi:MAG: ABC transporter ATP-binding protein [Thalassobius sp.]|nr:ABC transporter ATP-binding protein [Thalassovita sp.]
MEEIVKVENVVKKYDKHLALNDVSLSIPKGSIYGLLGPNGAGKTSLIRIITRITVADQGKVYFNNELLAPQHTSRMGYLPEERGLYRKMKVGEQLMYLSRLKGLSKHEVNRRLKYWVEKFEIKTWMHKQVEELSKGMQQKIQFIATVLHEPELLILDEPFSGFDPVNANVIKKEILRLKNKGCSVIFSTHRMESVEELCDNIALINNSKKVIEGTKEEIKASFSTNTFTVLTNKAIEPNGLGIEVIESAQAGNYVKNWIKSTDKNLNALIAGLVQDYEIHEVKEHIPSMDEIFIKMVGTKEEEKINE